MEMAARPSPEQISRIRQLSEVSLGDPGRAFEKYGYPSTRHDASEVLRKLDAERGWGGEDDNHEDEKPPKEVSVSEEQTKRCPSCDITKPVSEFGTNASTTDGLQRKCRICNQQYQAERYRIRKAKERKPEALVRTEVQEAIVTEELDRLRPSEPDPEQPNWRDRFDDPRVSELVELQEALGIPTLEEAAAVARQLFTGFTGGTQ